MSSDAALQAGAITADTMDGGSVWYNPAGLARMRGARFDVNVSAYALKLGGKPDLDGGGSESSKTSLNVLNFAPVPVAISLTKRFKNFTAGFGIFVPKMEIVGLRTRVVEPSVNGNPSIDFSIDYHQTSQSLYGGPAFGLRLGRGVDLGASFFVNYRSTLGTGDASIAFTQTDGSTSVVSSHELVDWLEIGIGAALGVQLQLSQRLRAGLNLRMPTVRVFQILDQSEITTTAVAGAVVHDAKYHETLNIPLRLLYPPRLHAGVSYTFTDSRLALETSYQAPFRNPETGEDFRPLFNFRAGFRHTLKNHTSIGGGLFTNRSTNRPPEVLGEEQIDYYGLSIATQFGTPYEVSSKDGKVMDPVGHLTFGSSFSFSYAMGFGKVIHGEVGFDDAGDHFFREVPVHVVAHEWILSVGSSLME
jgi:opacity protein-like surface antigen